MGFLVQVQLERLFASPIRFDGQYSAGSLTFFQRPFPQSGGHVIAHEELAAVFFGQPGGAVVGGRLVGRAHQCFKSIEFGGLKNGCAVFLAAKY